MPTTRLEQKKSWLILAALWVFLLLLASLRPLAVPDEGRYGEVGRWMLQSGDWLTPRLNGIPFFHKPPLLHWLEAISLATFGVNPFALRLVPALHAGLTLVALYLSARRISSELIARRAAIMLGTSLSFFLGGHYINHDMMVATWIGLAIWCFAFAFMTGDQPNRALARWGFVACALGMLSKGLIGVALPGLVIFVWLVWTRQTQKIRHLPWLSGLALFALIALPWFVMAQHKYPDFFNYMFIGQQFHRFTATTYNNPQPWWFYLMSLAFLFFPWGFLSVVPVATRLIAKEWWSLCWIWFVTITLFFSIPNSKLVGYILPVIPALALLSALGWECAMAHRASANKVFATVCLVNMGVALVIVTQVGEVTRTARTEDIALVLACAAHPSDTLYAAGSYPYDLPFYAQTQKPMVILDDWPALRQQSGDGWQRELFEGADFDAQAAKVLQKPEVLTLAGVAPGHWFVARLDNRLLDGLAGWKLFYQGAGWALYQSGHPFATQGPDPAEQEALPGCKDPGHP